MLRYLIAASLILVGIIHLLPMTGVLGGKQLERLYGINVSEPNLEIMLRHRAVLFGILGVFSVVAAFWTALQIPAFVMGFASVLSFLWLARSVGRYNDRLGRVFTADLIALMGLIVGAISYGLAG
jgi:hypothetical protein